MLSKGTHPKRHPKLAAEKEAIQVQLARARWRVLSNMGGHHHRQKYIKYWNEQSKQKWFSDGLQNEIIGFEMELSKYERLSVLLRSDSIKSEMG